MTSLPNTTDLTLEEKVALTSGAGFWHTEAIERLGIPSIVLTDGPHGVRKQRAGADGFGDSEPATCFPPAVALGCSWDPALVARVGAAIGAEAAAQGVAVLLGPGVNIKRTPLCGRTFEYFSEDPVVSGVLGAAMVSGIQSRGVGASLKHFAANNQESDRMRVSADIDPRPLREIYLRAFAHVVREAKPWTVMCSYNRINGVYTAQDPWLLTTVLRQEWGFDGVVVSDWGAADDRPASLAAGLDLAMPGPTRAADAAMVVAVEAGTVAAHRVDEAAARVLSLIERTRHRSAGPVDHDAHHALAREAAGRSIVLLRNEGGLLPLRRDADIAVVGAFAAEPRYQGGGSSKIAPTRLDNALDEIRALATGTVTYHRGDRLDDAAAGASAADIAVVFLGLPDAAESEGYDRDDIDLPAEQVALLDAVLAANPRTVVVLSNGGVVALPFAEEVPALLEGWLLGQAGGGAVADVLFGVVNPSAKLTETIPLRLQDTPAYLDFPGDHGHVRYGEGLFVGYRWYDARGLDVAFPFGHGLSYTSFDYHDASATVDDAGDIAVAVSVTNTGAMAGREIVQVYTGMRDSTVARAPRECKAFVSVPLEPGETREVRLTIAREDLAYWDIRVDGWIVEAGVYTVDVAASSRDIRASLTLDVVGDDVRLPLTRMSSIGEALAHPVAGPALAEAMASAMPDVDGTAGIMPDGVDVARMLDVMPIGRAGVFAAAAGADVDPTMIDALLETAERPAD